MRYLNGLALVLGVLTTFGGGGQAMEPPTVEELQQKVAETRQWLWD